jgi:hypothetical protein
MNLLECTVKKVLGISYLKYEKWWRKVEYNCYGLTSKTDLMFNTKEEADNLQTGYVFLA